jgi:methionyl-tRNA formyltransferase
MGTPEFAVPTLETLLGHRYSLPAVVTAPDKPRGRGQQVSSTPVKRTALKHNIPVLQPESLLDAPFTTQVRDLHPDLIVVVAFRILPRELFALPRLGSINLHASLLPRYRGAAPINWAIINGETETGVTTFFLQEKVDTGNILLQRAVPIGPEDDAGSVHDTLARIGADVVLETVRMIEEGRAIPKAQDNALVSPAPKIFKDDCRIRWNQPAAKVHDFIRGLSPHPAAFVQHNGKVIKIFRSALTDLAPTTAGEVNVDGESLLVSAADCRLAILELQQEGKTRMNAAEFLRGYRIASGERFL